MKYLVAALLFLATPLMAQNAEMKIGYMNSMELLYQMPEFKEVQEALQKYQEELTDELKKLVDQFRSLQDEIENKQATMSATILSLKRKQLAEMQQNLQLTQATFEEEMEEKQMLLLQPLLDKINKAVKKVAADRQLLYVLDSSKGLLLFADESGDISNEVREALNIKVEQK
jgi:outer membrane protein